MNSIAEDFLSEIDSHGSGSTDNVADGVLRVVIAESLASKVERFIEWLDIEQFEMTTISKDRKLWSSDNYVQLYEMTLAELYAYWVKEIDKEVGK